MIYGILLGEDTKQKIHNFIKNNSISIITMETITTKKGQKSSKSNAGISKIIFSSLILLAVIMASGCIDLDEKEPPEENCDSKHLSLCDNKNDCKGAGGYWHNNQCNEEREEFKCQPIEETVAMGDAVMGENIDMEVFFKVKGEVEGKCEIYEKIVKDNTGLGLEGKDMTCKIPMGAITANNPLTNNIKDYCNGSLADAIKDLTKEVKEK